MFRSILRQFSIKMATVLAAILDFSDRTMTQANHFFLMNVFFALKGSKLFIIISYHWCWMLCRVAAVKSLPALIYSADYILLLVL